jgi:hypothetical protein
MSESRRRNTLPAEAFQKAGFDKGFLGWTIQQIRSARWALPRYLGEEDLLGEAFVVFLSVKKRLGSEASQAALMAYYKTCFKNVLAGLRTANSTEALPYIDTDGEEVSFPDQPAEECIVGSLGWAVFKPPAEVFAVLKLLATDDGRELLRSPRRRTKKGARETNSQFYSRILGSEKAVEPRRACNDWLRGGSKAR